MLGGNEFFKRDTAICNEVVRWDGSAVKNCESKRLSIGNFILESLIPYGFVRFRFGRCPINMILVNIDRNVRIYQLVFSLRETDGMSRLEVCRPQIESFADFYLQASRKHLAGGDTDSQLSHGFGIKERKLQTRTSGTTLGRTCTACEI